MTNNFYAVIMAGGGGTRLWPVSRQARPKQMVRLGGERTLFQQAVDRVKELIPAERTFVVTVANQANELQTQYPEIPKENFLIEPMPRGTASVVGLAAVALRQRDPHGVMAVLTADHIILNEPYYLQVMKNAYTLAQGGHLVTLGIRPTFPATGYGYIQRGEKLEQYPFTAYSVLRFKEKPDEATARVFMERGDHDWNSGMFVWRIDRIWEEISRLMPDLAEKLTQINRAWGTDEQQAVVQSVWPSIQSQTVDYGIMERASQVAVVPAVDLGWNDVGSWESMFDVYSTDQHGNVILDPQHVGLDTSDTLVFSDGSDRLVVTLGIDHLVVVNTPDAVLICSRKNVQQVKEIVGLLKQKDKTQYL